MKTVEADGFKIKVKVDGEGTPVVILHGSGGISEAPGLARIAEKHQTFAIEIPGFGESGHNDRSTSMRELAGTVSKTIEALELGQHSVIASSASARLGLWHAIDTGSELESLVLVSPAAILLDGVRVPTIPPSLLIRSVGTGMASPAGLTSPTIGAQEEQLLKRIFGEHRDAELEKAMATLSIPTLVIFGDEDYQVPSEVGRLYREILPKGYNILFHKAGPLIAYERPEAFASVVLDFLEWRDEFVYSHKSTLLNP